MAVLMVCFYMAPGRQQLLCDFAACRSVWRYFSVFWPRAVKKGEKIKKFVKCEEKNLDFPFIEDT